MEVFTKEEYVYQRLHEDILNGQFPSGSRIIVKDLVEKYQVSAIPIRNAITRLVEQGFVSTSAHQGTWVVEINLQDYFTFMMIRVEVEAMAASFAAKRRDDGLIPQLERIYATMETAQKSNDYETYGMMNKSFHEMVYHASGNPALIEYINTLIGRTQIAVSLFGLAPQSSLDACQEHWNWIEAIRTKDAQRSAKIARYHRSCASLKLMYAIRDGHPFLQGNGYLDDVVAKEESKRYVEEFTPIFEEIKRKNEYK